MDNTDYVCIDNDTGLIKNIGSITNLPYTIYKSRCNNNGGTVMRLNNWINPKYSYCVDNRGKKYFDKTTCDTLSVSQNMKMCQVSNCPTCPPIDLWYDDLYKKIVYITLFWLVIMFIFSIWYGITVLIK